jgi:DNA-binding transcriptional MocR family regulator
MERRAALVRLAAEHNLLIVEDDVYRELAYDGAAPPSLWSMGAPGTVARLGSFAKSLAPGLRLGWLTADAALVRQIVGGGLLDSGGGVNHFTALTVAQLGALGLYDEQVARLRAAARRAGGLSAVRLHMDTTARRLLRVGAAAGRHGRGGAAAPCRGGGRQLRAGRALSPRWAWREHLAAGV